MTQERIKKIKALASFRQDNLCIVLENVHDPHNIGAVLRTCDAMGIFNVYILVTDDRLPNTKKQFLKEKASSGAKKWLNIHFHTNTEECFKDVQKKYSNIFASYLNQDSTDLYDLNFTSTNTALVFGNEHQGITEEALKHCDDTFYIPQVGMVQSLNISVACAITLYEAYRQKKNAGHYQAKNNANILKHYLDAAPIRK